MNGFTNPANRAANARSTTNGHGSSMRGGPNRPAPRRPQGQLNGTANAPAPENHFHWGIVPGPSARGPAAAADQQRYREEIAVHSRRSSEFTPQARQFSLQVAEDLKTKIQGLQRARASQEEINVWQGFLQRLDTADRWYLDY